MSDEEILAELPVVIFAPSNQVLLVKKPEESASLEESKVSTSVEDTIKEIESEAGSDQTTSKKENTASTEVEDSNEAAAQVEMIKAGLIDFLAAQDGNTASDASTSEIFKEPPELPTYNEPCTAQSSPEPPQNQEEKPRVPDEEIICKLPVINFAPRSQVLAVEEPEEGDSKVSTSKEDTLEEVKCPEVASEQVTSKNEDEVASSEVKTENAAAQEDELKKESGDSLVAPAGSVSNSDAPQEEPKEHKEPTTATEPSTAPSSPEPTRTQRRRRKRVVVSRLHLRITRGRARQDSDEDRPLAQIAGSSDTPEPKSKQAKREEK